MTRFEAEEEHAQSVHTLFSRIARRYDLLNRLMTGGQDVHWRKEVIRRAELKAGALLLDIGAGTGDLAHQAQRQQSASKVFAADFTLEMMRAGQAHGRVANWSAADALALPFAAEVFDAVVSGFLVRNVSNVDRALREQFRVLKSGGHIVILDTTRPGRNILTPLIWLHMHILIPMLGQLLAGESRAYSYLSNSTEAFLTAEALADRMSAAGFRQVGFHRRMLGLIAIHWGTR